MKLSKNLIQAIAIGITIGAASSCTPVKEASEVHLKTCEEGCDIDHGKVEQNNHHYDCPACGMG